MTDETFPHEIWADLDHWIEGPAASDLRAQGYMKYIRQDVSDALIASSVEASADLILQRAYNYYSKPGDAQSGVRTFASAAHDWLLEDVLNTNARQALDALLKAEREKALREAAEVCFAEKWKPKCSTDWVLARVKGHILALIEKDATDG